MQKIKQFGTMAELVDSMGDMIVPFSGNSTCEVKIIQKTKSQILVDVAAVAIGIIPEGEFSYDVEDLKVGDKVLVYILMLENEDGMMVLSLKRADKDRVWNLLQNKYESHEPIKVKISSVNRGGLLIEFGGIDGFIPVSQLAPAHYPKVEGGDANKILTRLKILVGATMTVKVLSIDQKTNKLIFSEKAYSNERLITASEDLQPGQKLKATVTGIVDFGIFVKLDIQDVSGRKDKIDGLIHISEISWNKDEDWKKKFQIGQKLDVAVVSTSGGKVSLTLKRLEEDPWKKASRDLKEGEKVEAEITRLTPFGAFVKIDRQLDALVHISQMDKGKQSSLKEGEKYKFYILKIDPDNRRINLSMKKPESEDKANKNAKKIDKKSAVIKVAKKVEKKIVKKEKAKKSTGKITKKVAEDIKKVAKKISEAKAKK